MKTLVFFVSALLISAVGNWGLLAKYVDWFAFCVTALECAIHKIWTITINIGGLCETAKNGLLINVNNINDVYNKEWQINTIKTIFNEYNKKNTKIEENYLWATQTKHSWEFISNQLLTE